jgi:hypothetical protein
MLSRNLLVSAFVFTCSRASGSLDLIRIDDPGSEMKAFVEIEESG